MYPGFTNLLHDLSCLFVAETKLDIYDEICIDNFIYYSKPRKQKYHRKSGGLGVFVCNDISHHVNIIDGESEYILWLNVKKSLPKLKHDVIIGVTYVPPLYS